MDQVFEAGQVWELNSSGDYVTREILRNRCDEPGKWRCELDHHFVDEWFLSARARLIAPAPKPGMRWSNGISEAEVVDARDVLVINEIPWHSRARLTEGNAIACARWLLDNGYKPVDGKTAPASDLHLATVLDSTGRLGHIWQTGDKCEITWVDGPGETTVATYSVTYVRISLDTGSWNRIEVPAKEESKPDSHPSESIQRSFYHPAEDLRLTLPSFPSWPQIGCTIKLKRPSLYPNLRAARPFADVVAAIFATPSREQSRRYVDMAVAAIKGEPFWRAIQAVLVHAMGDGEFERDALSPDRIVRLINGARAWERRRSEVAPGVRRLSYAQDAECWWAATIAAGERGWLSGSGAVYERARSL